MGTGSVSFVQCMLWSDMQRARMLQNSLSFCREFLWAEAVCLGNLSFWRCFPSPLPLVGLGNTERRKRDVRDSFTWVNWCSSQQGQLLLCFSCIAKGMLTMCLTVTLGQNISYLLKIFIIMSTMVLLIRINVQDFFLNCSGNGTVSCFCMWWNFHTEMVMGSRILQKSQFYFRRRISTGFWA